MECDEDKYNIATYFHTQLIQKSSARRTLSPSPLAGEGDRAEAKPSEVGRGVVFIEDFYRQVFRSGFMERSGLVALLVQQSMRGRCPAPVSLTADFFESSDD